MVGTVRQKRDVETKKRFRKQVMAGIVTVLMAVSTSIPEFIIGCQQGAVIAALCANPLLLEVVTRQRVATERN